MVPLDAFSIAVTEDPTSFGILTPRAAFLVPEEGIPDAFLQAGAVSVAAGPVAGDQAGYWDVLHPGEAIHQAWGAYLGFAYAGGESVALDFNDETYAGSGSAEAVFAYAGHDLVRGFRGEDILLGGSGDDTLLGGGNSDVLSGGTGNDNLRGGRGADVIGGGQGDDTLSGGQGGDLLIDGLGADLLRGGRGNDRFIFVQQQFIGGDETPDGDVVRGGGGDDTLIIAAPQPLIDAFADNEAGLLAALGLQITSIETITVVGDRAALYEELDDIRGGETADFWGFL